MVKESPVVISGEESVLEHLALLRPLMRTPAKRQGGNLLSSRRDGRGKGGGWPDVPHILKRASCARGVVQGDPTGQHFPALALCACMGSVAMSAAVWLARAREPLPD